MTDNADRTNSANGASRADGAWQDVLDESGQAARARVRLAAGRLDDQQAGVTLTVDEDAAGPLEFGDNLYGATAWVPDGPGWRRADTAQLRLMIMMLVQPGEQVEISLPLDGRYDLVRVLLDGQWVDLRR